VAECTAGRGLLKHGLRVKNRKDSKYDLCPDYAALVVDTPSLEPLCLKDPSKKWRSRFNVYYATLDAISAEMISSDSLRTMRNSKPIRR